MKTIRKLKWMFFLFLVGWTCFANAQTWESLSGNVGSMAISSGTTRYIRLTGDVYMAGNIQVYGTLTLDLNGHVLKRSDHQNYLIGVLSGGECTVKDSNPNTSHYGKPATIHVYNDDFDYLWDYDASYTAATPGAIEIKGGIITGGIGQTGGAIFNKGTFNLEGGTIAGNFIYCGPFRVKEGNPAAWVTKIEHPWKFDGQHPNYNFNHIVEGNSPNGCYVEYDSEGEPTGFYTIRGQGGGIWSGCGATLNMSGGRICYNYAAFHGGGIYCAGKFNMTGGVIDNNYTLGGYGGGVFVNHVTETHPNLEGGLTPVGEMVMDGGEMYSNTSWGGSGGAIMAWKDSYLTINNGSFYYNKALGNRSPKALGNGGAIYGEQATMVIKNIDIQRNFAHRYGGGIYIWLGSDLKMDEGTCIINGNKATSGGGIAVAYPTCTATLGTGVEIKNDTALLDGGGIFMQGGELNNNGANIENCVAGNNGGGVAMWIKLYKGNITYNMTAGYIQNNSAGTSDELYEVTGVPVDVYRSGGGISITSDKDLVDGQEENKVKVTLDGGVIRNNKVIGDYGKHGGGLFVSINTNNSSATIDVNAGASFENNEANEFGGGFYLNSGTINVNGGKVNQNIAGINGGGVFIGGETSSITVSNGGEINGNTANLHGGGFYAEGGSVLVQTDSYVDNNTASTGNGGGIYSISGVTVDSSSVSNNTAVTGGGLYVASGSSSSIQTLIQNGSRVDGNNANNGAGAYVESGILKVLDNTTQVNSNTATTSGGGIYMHSGNVEVTSAMMEGNTATAANGGGLYVGNGDITLSGAKVSGNVADNGKGGGIYAGNGNIQVKDGAEIGTYSAKAGSGNSASEGGGLYVNGGTVVFTNGTFADNYASEKGGGIYIKEGATLNLRETATLTRNHVPATGQGGGVYMDGTLNVGENADDPATKHSIIARDNYASDEVNPEITSLNRNNVFLPSTTKYITLLSDIHASNSKVGFSVTQGFCPVIYTDIAGGNASHEQWLYDLLGGTSGLTGAIFDDAQHYFALHVRTDQGPFEAKYDYLWGSWTTYVNKNPNDHTDEYPLPTGIEHHYEVESDGWHIYTREGLAWFISHVNGLNSQGVHHSANAFLENDVDMSGNLWVPIGGTQSFDDESGIFTPGGYYEGNFDGQGHVIRNLDCRYLNAVLKIGLFGNVTGGSIRNTFVDGYEFTTQFDDKAYYLGGIAGHAKGGVISNCEARGVMSTDYCLSASSYMGGLVGMVDGATVHSSMAMPTMSGTARHMGGLVGQLNADNTLKNSFSNAEITRNDANSIIGGLVGTNLGTVENCYVRLRGSEPTGFGWFAGNNGGTINYCYAPDGISNYVNTGTAPVGSGNYADTELFPSNGGKYGYAHQDQDVTATNDYVENGAIGNDGELKGLLATLNNWVKAQPATGGYSKWTRTMASPMNGDYPILEFNDFVSAATTDNIFIAYRNNLDEMIDYANGNSTGGSVYLYGVPGTVTVANNANVKIFVNENIGFLQNVTLQNVRTGITLDNSSRDFMAYDWHMFSPALTDAPMGLIYNSMVSGYDIFDHYNTYLTTGLDNSVYGDVTKMDPPQTTWSTTTGQIGYFPTNTPYGPWRGTGSINDGFDFYCYSEPYTHWINFKREGNRAQEFYDHWHQDEDNNGKHWNIPYENETTMKRGKGYMVAITEPSMLMTDGTLDNNQVTVEVSNTDLTGYEAPLKGVNLIGNPYQAYLDFNKIGNNLNTYFILDADARGYIAYVSDGSTPDVPGVVNANAPRYIHPHQGFFVHVPQGTTTLTLNNTMIQAGNGTSSFRSETNHYPMVNMAVEDERGRRDYTTVELDRPETGGGEKIQGLHAGDASLWVRHDDTDWQVAFTKPGTREVPVRFKAYQDGTFTLSWGAYNGYFSYLHLIDNLTGADIDCLMADEYRFEATTHDYTSRFRLVFDFTGVEENDEPTEGPTSFAFMMGDELVINGEGVLQMFDLNGRQLFSTEIHGTQATVAMPKVADGIYVLRLTNGNQVRTQKMVINK